MKITGEAECPNCKKEHPVSFDIDKLDVKNNTPTLTNVQVSSAGTPATVQQVLEPEVKPKVITKVPSYIPKYKCKNCNENHKNKDYTQKPKFKCSKCGQFSPDGQSCLWCNNKEFDELDEDELEDLGIEEPEEHDHEDE